MTGRQAGVLLSVLMMAFSIAHAQITKPLVRAQISRLADTAHLEFSGLHTWHYDVQHPAAGTVTISVPPMDDASIARLQGFNDPLVKSVKVDKNGTDGSYVLTIDLGNKDVESFDYLTDDPSRLIVDFYRKAADETKKAQVKSELVPAQKKTKAHRKTRKIAAQKKADLGRKPAGDEVLDPGVQGADGSAEADNAKDDTRLHFGIFDGGDENYDRFRIKDYEIREDAIISSRHNIYLPFPMLKMGVSRLDQLTKDEPEYIIHPKSSRENKEARLLLVLYQRQRYGVFLKTYDYFTQRYPDSEYLEILKNVAAAVHLKLWKRDGTPEEYDIARSMYNELVQKFPNSPLREHNYLIYGFLQLEHGEALATLQTFEGFQAAFPQSKAIPQVRKAKAEAFMILREYDKAQNEYQQIINDFPKTEDAREARFRMGDVAFAKKDYNEAIQTYEKAIKDLPESEKRYPNADFNMAESRFWQKDFKKSLNDYVRFVQLFPTNNHGGYALTRIGELLGILGADQRRVMGAFLESYFRFPNHPGAKVARIRMLSQQMRGMKEKEEKKAIEEIEGYAKSLDLPGIKEFTTLMEAEGLSNRGEYKEAIKNLISYYQKNPSANNLESFKSRILRNISNELKDEVDRGNFLQALRFYSKYANTWLKNSGRIDIPFMVARAYESAGAYGEAEKLYQDTLAQRQHIVGTDEEKEKKVQEHLPSISEIHLRLAASLFEDRDYLGAHENLKAIGKGEGLSDPELVERVQLSAKIAEQRNDPVRAREALMELAQKWKGDPALLAPVNLQLAQTFLKLGQADKAEHYADQVLKAEGGETQVPAQTVADAYQAKGEALVAEKRPMAAVETYQKLLERFESKLPLANVRYQVGQILFNRGDYPGAAEVWQKLQGTPNEFLWKVGKEKLDDAQWKSNYKKYLNRFPAMAERGKERKP